MITGRPLYRSPDDPSFAVMARGGIKEVVEVYESYGLRVSDMAKDLIYHMLQGDPSKRFTLEEVLLHPFITTFTGGHCFQGSSSLVVDGNHTILPPLITTN